VSVVSHYCHFLEFLCVRIYVYFGFMVFTTVSNDRGEIGLKQSLFKTCRLTEGIISTFCMCTWVWLRNRSCERVCLWVRRWVCGYDCMLRTRKFLKRWCIFLCDTVRESRRVLWLGLSDYVGVSPPKKKRKKGGDTNLTPFARWTFTSSFSETNLNNSQIFSFNQIFMD